VQASLPLGRRGDPVPGQRALAGGWDPRPPGRGTGSPAGGNGTPAAGRAEDPGTRGDALRAVYVIACSAGKAARPAAARDLYTGQGFRHALKAAEAQAAGCASQRMPALVVVLSALHGLITLDTVIAPYDLKMGQPGSVSPGTVAAQAASLGIMRGCEVHALLPRAYLAVLNAALRPQSIRVRDLYQGCRGSGDQRHVNRTLTSPRSGGHGGRPAAARQRPRPGRAARRSTAPPTPRPASGVLQLPAAAGQPLDDSY